MPFYLHPRNPLPSWTKFYEGHNWLLGPNWAFHAETAVHALRLIGSGLFDECPKLKIVLGHLGEGIPVYLWRIDNRNGWMKAPHKYAAKHGVAIISASTSISPHRAISTRRAGECDCRDGRRTA